MNTPAPTPPLPTAPPPPTAAVWSAPVIPAIALVVVLISTVLLGPRALAAPEAGPGSATPVGAVPPVPGAVVRVFDAPEGPYAPGHRGVDLAAHPGEDVVAALPGTVAFSGTVAGTGWVTLDHGGDLVTTYGPVEGRVQRGRQVSRGVRIGTVADGSAAPVVSEDAPAAHLDWGARLEGDYIDPMLLLQRWSLRLTDEARAPA